MGVINVERRFLLVKEDVKLLEELELLLWEDVEPLEEQELLLWEDGDLVRGLRIIWMFMF